MISTGEHVREVAGELAGTEIVSLSAAGAGANSRIFRVETAQACYALKCYPALPGDTRKRAEVEWGALSFLRSRGVGRVPEPYARDARGQFMLMEWIEGAPVRQHTACDLRQAADFLTQVFALSADPEAGAFPLASEACLSAAAVIRQIEDRLTQFVPDKALERFLDEVFAAPFAAAKRRFESARVELPPCLRRLTPADFGFHNVLRQPDGRLRYLDFEYFGWDDPAKVTADFILHPAMNLSLADRRFFVDRVVAALPSDREFAARLQHNMMLYALRWVLILFNPFRRDRSGELPSGEGRAALLVSRIDKARTVLERAG